MGVQLHAPGDIPPRKETRYPLYGRLGGHQGSPPIGIRGWTRGPVWTGAENLAANGIPARSKLLYRLSYTGPQSCLCEN